MSTKIKWLSEEQRQQTPSEPFRLDSKWVTQYASKRPPFGFNGLGELVYYRTYSRIKEDGYNEDYWETCKRVVNGLYSMQKAHVEAYGLGWDDRKAQKSAQEMYDRMFNMLFTPPGRGFWAMGSPITEERALHMALFNCAFTSTERIAEEGAKPFAFLMDVSMLGVGCGFDTKGEGMIKIKSPESTYWEYQIPDTREGWVMSLVVLLDQYFYGYPKVRFDYSQIRPAGQPIKGFGGKASGPEPLREIHELINQKCSEKVGRWIDEELIVDIMNLIGYCVVAGNVRRTAELAIGNAYSDKYLDLKNYEKNPDRAKYGWTSNNSIECELGMNYNDPANRTRINGEPGYIWTDNMKAYGRMGDPADYKDHRATGCNPCVEQTLEHYECCNLVETYINNAVAKNDYLRTLKFAYLYAKTVTLSRTHWVESNRIMLRNRRIGNSMTGVIQFLSQHGINDLKEWCEDGYAEIRRWDDIYSDWFAIPRSIKTTSIKPSGTVSLLAGSTPGGHFPDSIYFIRRMRISSQSALVDPIRRAGYPIEPDLYSKNTLVVEVPVALDQGLKTLDEVSMWEQLGIAAFLQRYWADNQVSYTVTFDPETEGDQIEAALDHFQYQLKAISFLPRPRGKGVEAYKQAVYEKITREEYEARWKQIKNTPLDFSEITGEKADPEKFCTTEKCDLNL